ncbi:MAG: ribose 5-phosphate isomerase B [Opitutales bacterium]|nr:ribose 5-phosphate isomerase B [Opitutales bacterium]
MSDLPSIALGSDHAGFRYKELLRNELSARGHKVSDFGTFSAERCDYPDFVRPAAEAVAKGECDLGIVLGGSGNGEAMVANKVHGIRCAVCWNVTSARLCKEHNNANIISLGERMFEESELFDIVDAWLNSTYEAGRHQPRLDKVDAM